MLFSAANVLDSSADTMTRKRYIDNGCAANDVLDS